MSKETAKLDWTVRPATLSPTREEVLAMGAYDAERYVDDHQPVASLATDTWTIEKVCLQRDYFQHAHDERTRQLCEQAKRTDQAWRGVCTLAFVCVFQLVMFVLAVLHVLG